MTCTRAPEPRVGPQRSAAAPGPGRAGKGLRERLKEGLETGGDRAVEGPWERAGEAPVPG